MRVLLVCGFWTHYKESGIGNVYQIFRVRFTNDEFKLFKYSQTEPLGEVRDRLATVLQEREYDLILGHYGGLFDVQFNFHRHNQFIPENDFHHSSVIFGYDEETRTQYSIYRIYSVENVICFSRIHNEYRFQPGKS